MHKLSLLGLVLLTTSCIFEAEVPLDDLSGPYTVTEGYNYTQFTPTGSVQQPVGFLFYPGGSVASEAYFELLTPLTEEGYTVVVVDMPLQLAAFSPQRGRRVLQRLANAPDRWVIGGHSLGGSMAARQVYKEPDLFEGLVLMASYPANTDDLSTWEGRVLSIYGSEDAIALPSRIRDSDPLLPPDTEYVEIAGGNHAQFGSYGEQDPADVATISKEAQQQAVREALRAFLAQ